MAHGGPQVQRPDNPMQAADSTATAAPQAPPVEVARVLVVDDNTTVLDIFRKILTGGAEQPSADVNALDLLESAIFLTPVSARKTESPRFEVDCLDSGEQACQLARVARDNGRPFALAFVDMRMPGGWDGLETIEGLWKADPAIHIVICTAYSDYSWDDILDRLGLSDRLLVLRKPFEKIEVLQMASALSQKWRTQQEQQLTLATLEQRITERTQALSAALAERQSYATQLQHQATHDTLTGLANRSLLHDHLSQAIAFAARNGHDVWIVFVDLDRFKTINDTLGHKAGDVLLNTMAARLKAALRESDTVARLGGDEFVLVLPGFPEGRLSAQTIHRIMQAIAQPIELEGRDYSLTSSVGVAIYPADASNPLELLEYADMAMYRAKELGRNNFQFFTAEMNVRLHERIRLEQALKDAIDREEFTLHYQPQVDLHSGQIIGVEALIRWQHPELGLVSPIRFIGLAEETGLISVIGAWVFRTACLQNKAWQRAGLPSIRVAVNLSARQLADPLLVESIAGALRETELAPACLEIEITESSVMADVEHSVQILRQLKALGIKLAIDDFGTGYSSLAYLKRFPIDVLKIDQSFVRDVETDPNNAAIVNSIISLAHNLQLDVIAEGVETSNQLAYLQRQRCDLMQGFHFSRPLPVEDVAAILREGKCLVPAGDPMTGRPRSLLIVDDDALLVAQLAMQLEPDGYRILTALSAEDAFDVLAGNHVDVVLCDQMMPGMSGVEFLERMRGLYPETVRMMLSVSAEPEAILNAINRGAVSCYLVKPCEAGALRDGVRNAFRSKLNRPGFLGGHVM
jgi:diguanylate cyclase (GGDEF)-like protein